MREKRLTVYAFIDSQNLNLGTSKDITRRNEIVYRGWKLDYEKFIKYLRDKFRVRKAFLFIGYIEQNGNLYRKLKKFGYELIFKPTVKDNQGKPKGNVDAELVLHCVAVEFKNYDKSVIVSGDGDFHCLLEFLEAKGKLISLVVPNSYSESSLLKRFQSYKTILNKEREKLKLEP